MLGGVSKQGHHYLIADNTMGEQLPMQEEVARPQPAPSTWEHWHSQMLASSLPDEVKQYLSAVAEFTNCDMTDCWPARKKIVDALQWRLSQVMRREKEAERAGWIRIHALYTEQRRISNLYQFLIPAEWEGPVHCSVDGISISAPPSKKQSVVPSAPVIEEMQIEFVGGKFDGRKCLVRVEELNSRAYRILGDRVYVKKESTTA
jgi:hypothetical protein